MSLSSLNPGVVTSYNTAVGVQAGDALTTGTNNTFLGALTDASAVGATNQTVIGYTSDWSS